MPADFHFIRPLWLLALVPLALLLWRLTRRGQGDDVWRGLVDPHLLAHLLEDGGGRVRRLPLILLGLGWLLGVTALAGPAWERLPQPVYQVEGRRVILLDISPTMNAADVPPSRLARARFEVLDLLKRGAEGQTALLAFGAEPFVVSPLTTDTDTIAAQVPNLETALLPVDGPRRTDLALEAAGELLRQADSPDGEVILVTDGLDRPAAAQEAARRLLGEGYRVSVLAVGTEKGAPVPGPDGFFKDASGAIRLARLETDTLQALATAGGGRFVAASADDRDGEYLIPDPGARLSERAGERDTGADQWREEGPWLLLALLPLAAVGFRRGWLTPLLLVLLMAPHPPATAFDWEDLWLRPDQRAARAYAAGDHAQAAEGFERPDWQAAAHYAAGDYARALESLAGLPGAEADYNKGNALARLGELEPAIAEYDRVLAADPGHEDARYNRELVRKLLEERQRQQQEQPGQGEQSAAGQEDSRPQGQPQGQGGTPEQARDRSSAAGGEGGGGEGEGEGQADGDRQPQDPSDRQEAGAGEQGAEDAAPAQSGQSGPENLGEGADAGAGGRPSRGQDSGEREQGTGESPRSAGQQHGSAAPAGEAAQGQGKAAEPGLADLLGDGAPQGAPRSASASPQEPGERERYQAMEQMLRRVPDDPGGLLRQRFLLQHLRRDGRLP